MKISACNNISDLRSVARQRLPEPVFHYLDGGSDDEVALRRNTTAFDDYELIYGFSARPRSRFRQVTSFLRHPLWLKRALIDRDLEMANLVTSPSMQTRDQSDLRTFIVKHLERSLTWKDVEWLRARWDGTLVIKGVQSVGDCQKARAAGANAVMISNHGGRQLDSAPAPIDCIARIADALAGDLEIVCDGGIRRGSHVVKALAAGANAVGIGRAYLFGLAAGGEAGVRHALTLLHNELVNCMGLAGVRSVAEIQRDLLQRHR